jgi:hypothetical protein
MIHETAELQHASCTPTFPSNRRQEMFSVGARLRAEDGTPLFYFSNKHESRSTLHVAMLCNYYLHIVKASVVLVSWRMSPFSVGPASKVSLNKLQNKSLNVLLQDKGTEVRSCRIWVKVKVNLRPTVSRPVCLGVRRLSGTCDKFFFLLEISFRQLCVCYFVAPSLTRGLVCNLLYNCFWALPEQSLLGRSPAELTTIFYCLIWDSPNLEGQVSVFISPRNKEAQLYPPGTGLRIRGPHSGSYECCQLLECSAV